MILETCQTEQQCDDTLTREQSKKAIQDRFREINNKLETLAIETEKTKGRLSNILQILKSAYLVPKIEDLSAEVLQFVLRRQPKPTFSYAIMENEHVVADVDRIYNLLPKTCHKARNLREFAVLCDITIDMRNMDLLFSSKDELFERIKVVLDEHKRYGMEFPAHEFELTLLQKAEEVLLSYK